MFCRERGVITVARDGDKFISSTSIARDSCKKKIFIEEEQFQLFYPIMKDVALE